jgi:polysaccharide export outer membrane protein
LKLEIRDLKLDVRSILIFLLSAVLFSSCVMNKQVQLIQKDDVNVKGLPKDSVVRSYGLASFNYKIQPNDILYVEFESLTPADFDFLSKNNVTQQGQFQTQGASALVNGDLVDPQGDIPFLVVGKVKVQGLTIFEIQEKLQAVADQYLDSPLVKVRLINFRITVLGEVAREGSVVLANNRVSMLEAIGLAGGLGELADRSNVKLIRQVGSKTEIAYINLLDENFMNSPYYFVNQNDVLVVPPLKQRPFRKYFGQNLALITSSLALLLLTINVISNN